MQETFVRLVRSDIDLSNSDYVSGWLIRVAANLCKNQIRKTVNARQIITSEADTITLDQCALSRFTEREADEEIVALLHECIDQLPNSLQKIVQLRYFQQREISEMAASMNTTDGAIYAQLNRARQKIKAGLQEKIRRKEAIL